MRLGRTLLSRFPALFLSDANKEMLCTHADIRVSIYPLFPSGDVDINTVRPLQEVGVTLLDKKRHVRVRA